jgi:serine protease Do
MNKVNKTYFLYVIIFVLSLLTITNTILLTQIADNRGINNTKTSSIKVEDDTTKVVQKVSKSVVTVALERNRQIIGNGSGSIISYKNGEVRIVTNNHVINEPRTRIKIIFANNKTAYAKIVGKDNISDIAVLKANINFKVDPIQFGDSDVLQQGESVIAIGSPLDVQFTGTVTKGVVSGLNRSIPADTNNDGEADYNMKVLQTDTTINPGNSGGPLINMAGQLVGINTSKLNIEGFEGMGFSIPSNEAKHIIKQLEQKGNVTRPTLGISYRPLSSIPMDMYPQLNINSSETDGIYIVSVQANSSAAKAGLKSEDVITKVNNMEINTPSIFTSELYSSKKGDKLKLMVKRASKKLTIIVNL